MRPLFHPAIEDVRPEAILHALSDPERATNYASITATSFGATCSTFANTGERVVPKSSLSQHIKVLREAGLIRCERHGVEMRNHSRLSELDEPLRNLVVAALGAYKMCQGESRKSR